MPMPLHQSHCPNEMMPLLPSKEEKGWDLDDSSVLFCPWVRPIHGHGLLAFLSTDLGSSGPLAMPAKGTVTLDTTNDMEAMQS
jgi:hypothetical protein